MRANHERISDALETDCRSARLASANGAEQLRANFGAAEMRWLIALSAYHTDADEEGSDARWIEERSASSAFVKAPAPTLIDLPRKLWLLEREASEVVYNGTPGAALIEWLTEFRSDLQRLLREGQAASRPRRP